MRSHDIDGRLFVEQSFISKANVCPYKGSEIPDPEKTLGLDPDKVYLLYRDPVELEKAAPSFSCIPIMVVHIPVSAADPQIEYCGGTTGVVVWEAPYLVSKPMRLWTAEARDLVLQKKQEELSSAYHYRADMTPGEVNGERYDGVMRDIVGNHVALVSEGRAGSDVVVSDEQPEFATMKHGKMVAAAILALAPFLAEKSDVKKLGVALDAAIDKPRTLLRVLAPYLKKDADMLAAGVAMDAAMEDDEGAEDALTDEEREACYKSARDAKARDNRALDSELTDEEKTEAEKSMREKKATDRKARDSASAGGLRPQGMDEAAVTAVVKTALDAALPAAREQARSEAVASMTALYEARELVLPLVGKVNMALDSADKVYEFALKQSNVKTDGIHPSAFPALIGMALSAKVPARRPVPAMDAASGGNIADIFGSSVNVKVA